jgi:lipoate-protein ligase A
MFYTNTPCVVIGKNQNPWKEANLPLLNSLHIPLVRRNSGGGTVVHDMGNVNFSYMTTKEAFDRHKFAHIVAEAVNNHANPLVPLEVNKRGDIVTKSINGINYKVSGSAYKLAKGRSYHHGTMLLNLRLDILGQLLSRDESKLGKVDAMSSIPSVKAKVKNVEILSDVFRKVVINAFKSSSGEEPEIFEITKETELPSEVSELATQLTTREWVYGNTPKFTHELRSEKYGFTVRFEMDRKTVVSKVILQFDASVSEIDETAIRDSFQYLELMVKKGTLKYSGSEVAGFVTHDEISDWLGMAIDGTT